MTTPHRQDDGPATASETIANAIRYDRFNPNISAEEIADKVVEALRANTPAACSACGGEGHIQTHADGRGIECPNCHKTQGNDKLLDGGIDGPYNEADPTRAKRKLAYVKRWRTIVSLPEQYADEIVEALRATPPKPAPDALREGTRLPDQYDDGFAAGRKHERDRQVVITLDRDWLGRMVRHAWVEWAKTQDSIKPRWLLPYDELSEPDKEADRQIGEYLIEWAKKYVPATLSPAPVPDKASSLACAKCGMYYCTHSIDERFPSLAPVPPADGVGETRLITDEDREYASELLADLTNDDLPRLEIAARWFCKARVEHALAPLPAGAGEAVAWRWSDDQLYFAARSLALSNPDAYEDKSHKGSLKPNQKAMDAASMALGAAIRHGASPPVRGERESLAVLDAELKFYQEGNDRNHLTTEGRHALSVLSRIRERIAALSPTESASTGNKK